MGPWAIETQNLHKVYYPSLRAPWRKRDPVNAVVGVELQVRQGELFGLLGPNGAGKTTLIKMLCTLIVPSSGSARVMGYDLAQEIAIKAAVGLVVADERSFYWRLSGMRNLLFFGAMAGLPQSIAHQRAMATLAMVGLTDHAKRRFGEYSAGMRQRLAIARSLLHEPKILFLDEPTRSLDPLAASALHTLIRELAAQGVTVFLTTHNLGEAEILCDRIALMHQGKIRACAPPAELRRALEPGEKYRLLVAGWNEVARASLSDLISKLERMINPHPIWSKIIYKSPLFTTMKFIAWKVRETSGYKNDYVNKVKATGLWENYEGLFK